MFRNNSSHNVARNERITGIPPKGLTLFPAETGRRFSSNVKKLTPLKVFIRARVRPKDKARAIK
tara:strand:- start:10 stop:201 length:192 start_codon:yes stop_codon:yes gene_type:complete